MDYALTMLLFKVTMPSSGVQCMSINTKFIYIFVWHCSLRIKAQLSLVIVVWPHHLDSSGLTEGFGIALLEINYIFKIYSGMRFLYFILSNNSYLGTGSRDSPDLNFSVNSGKIKRFVSFHLWDPNFRFKGSVQQKGGHII